ncbi:MAG: M4 family metallopeptidase [Chitinophagales bacterium]
MKLNLISCSNNTINHTTKFIYNIDLSEYAVQFDLNYYNPNIIAHEWGHGINQFLGPNFSSLYEESQILSEGFSDIFGIRIQEYMNEKYNLGISDPNWLGNTEPGIASNVQRSKANPKNFGSLYNVVGTTGLISLNHPDYYQGENWHGTNFTYDNDPSHHNSTVFSHWYYLVSLGGLKTNEVGDTYDIVGLGMQGALDIVMRAMTEYMVSNGEFIDMRRATIQSTIDLYGYCDALHTVIDAWDAVGVYDPSMVLPNNVFFNVQILSSQTFSNDTIFIIRDFTISPNVSVTFDNCLVFVSSQSDIISPDNSYLNIINSKFYFDTGAGITYDDPWKFNISNSQFNYSVFPCNIDSSEIDSTLNEFFFAKSAWKGIQLLGTPSSFGNITQSSIKNALVGFYSQNQSTDILPKIKILDNVFSENSIAILFANKAITTDSVIIEGNMFTKSIKNQLELNDFELTSPNSWYPNSFVPNFPNILGSTLPNPEHYTYFINVPKLLIKDNTFKNPYSDQTTSTNCMNGYCSQKTGVFIHNASSNFLFNQVNQNKFLQWDKCIETFSNSNMITLNENLFRYVDYYAVKTIGKASITNNQFEFGRQYGVHALNATEIEINNNNFNGLLKNIYAHGGQNITIKENYIGAIRQSSNDDAYGIFLNGIQNFEVSEDTIRGAFNGGPSNLSGVLQYGLVAKNSGSVNSYIFKNEFDWLPVNIQTEEDNSALKIKCNIFKNTNANNVAGILMFNGSLADQGANCTDGNNYQAGNEWQDNCSGGNVKDIILGPTASPFKYWAHGFNALSGNTNTIPDCNNLAVNYLKKCIDNSSTSTTEAYQEKDNTSCVSILDGWYKPSSSGGINAELLATLIKLQNTKEDYLIELSVLDAMLIDPNNQKEVVRKIEYYYNEIQGINRGIIDTHYKLGNNQAVSTLLENETTVESKIKLYDHYTSIKDYTNASSVLNDLIALYKPNYLFEDNQEEINYEDNKDYFGEVASIENNVLQTGRQLNALNSFEISTLQTIALSNLPISAKAEAILSFNGFDIQEPAIQKLTSQEVQNLGYSTLNSFDYALTASPNPANESVTVSYTLPDEVMDYRLELIDNYQDIGTLVYSFDGTTEESHTLTTSNLNNGTYTVALLINYEIVRSIQLLIIH